MIAAARGLDSFGFLATAMAACSHIDQVRFFDAPAEVAGCEECLKSGGQWVHLRMCQECGKVGCCDSSPNQHASHHAAEAAHPILRSIEPGEAWSYCAIDDVAFLLRVD